MVWDNFISRCRDLSRRLFEVHPELVSYRLLEPRVFGKREVSTVRTEVGIFQSTRVQNFRVLHFEKPACASG